MDPLTLFITTVGTAAGKAVATEGSKFVRELIGLQQAQVALLQRIDVKVDALLAGPLNTGRRHLIDAMSADRQPTDRTELLKAARTSFTEALGQDTEPARRSLAAIHLTAVWLALGSPNDAKRSLREAHLEALEAIAGVLTLPDSTLEAYLHGARGFFGGDAKNWLDRYRGAHGKGRQKTVERIEFANAISRARRNSGALPGQAPLVDVYRGLDIDAGTIERVYVDWLLKPNFLIISEWGPGDLKANEVPTWLRFREAMK